MLLASSNGGDLSGQTLINEHPKALKFQDFVRFGESTVGLNTGGSSSTLLSPLDKTEVLKVIKEKAEIAQICDKIKSGRHDVRR